MVDFYADWCGPCKVMAPILKSFKAQNQDITIYKIDVDKNIKVSEKYQIQSIPTLILFKKGKILWRKSGVVQATELQSLVTKYK